MSKKGLVVGVVVLAAVVGGAFTVKSIERIGTGQLGVQYSVNGVKEDTLSEGWHFINPFLKVKEFSIGNEQLVLEKTKDDDASIKVATSDDASIAISFQMSYRYKPEDVVATYKKFRGMDGQDIVDQRVAPVLKSKISEVTAGYSMMDVYSGNRSEINNQITEYLNEEFGKEYGIEVLDASIIDVHPDDKLKESIDARVKALQEKQQAEAEQEKVRAYTKALKEAKSYEELRGLFMEEKTREDAWATMAEVAQVRYTVDTRDSFYEGEVQFWNETIPAIHLLIQKAEKVILESPFIKEFAEEFGEFFVKNMEVGQK